MSVDFAPRDHPPLYDKTAAVIEEEAADLPFYKYVVVKVSPEGEVVEMNTRFRLSSFLSFGVIGKLIMVPSVCLTETEQNRRAVTWLWCKLLCTGFNVSVIKE